MRRFTILGVTASYTGKSLFAALKRCATQRHLPNTAGPGSPMPSLCDLVLVISLSVFSLFVFITKLSGAQAPAQSAAPAAESKPKADVIFVHANVYTGVPSNAQFSSILREEAIAVRGDRIQAVGKNVDIEKLKGPQTQIVDLGGHFVMPGFNDAHLHLADAGLQKLSVDLKGVKTLEEFRQRVLAKVEKAQPGEWILGGGWDETMWPVKALPSRWDLDEVSGGHPVFLDRVDGHLAVANTRALQLASVTLASKDPQGGKIDRDANGQPTGILRDTAVQAVRAVIPPPTHDMRRQGIELALADMAAHGVSFGAGLFAGVAKFPDLRGA